MVINIPSPDDFQEFGIDYLSLGWGNVLSIIAEIKDVEEWLDDEDVSVAWKSAEREVSTALSLVQQGAEFLLKSHICAISPWILVGNDTRDWPKDAAKADVSFGEFRTINAHDLVRVYNTIKEQRLPDEFIQSFNDVREKRNSVIHTADRTLRISATAVIEYILVVSEHLLGAKSWLTHRSSYLNRDRRSALHSTDGNEFILARELTIAISLLTPAKSLRFFGFNKRKRAYLCFFCRDNDSGTFAGETVQLITPAGSPPTAHCFACGNDAIVERLKCINADCTGSVSVEGNCIACGHPTE